MNEQIEEEYCCILEVCCGGHNRRNAKAALANKFVTEMGVEPENAARFADHVLEHFDLMPYGTTTDFKRLIAEMAREYPYNPE